MVGNVATILPPDELRPNQAEAASPMVCGWRLGKWLGHVYATGHEISHRRQLPWCTEYLFQEGGRCGRVWYDRKKTINSLWMRVSTGYDKKGTKL